MAKHFVANALGRIIDRSIQVHGALGYSTDTPLAHMYQHARWARFADGPDVTRCIRCASRNARSRRAYSEHGSSRPATGGLLGSDAVPRNASPRMPSPSAVLVPLAACHRTTGTLQHDRAAASASSARWMRGAPSTCAFRQTPRTSGTRDAGLRR